MKIPIDKGYLPDLMDVDMPVGGLIRCHNVYPYEDHYAPVKGLTAYSSDAVSGSPLGAGEFKASDGSYYTFVGTTTGMYRMESDLTMTDVTNTDGDYASGDNSWSFAQYGDWLVACNYADDTQILKSFDDAANFADLGGTPPKAKYVLFFNGHLIFAHTNESATAYPKRLRWSAFESIEDYTVSRTTGADFQDISDADGDITGLARIGTKFGVFCENSITVGWYTGPPYTFTMPSNTFKGIGGVPGTMVSVGDRCYFWDLKDIYVTDGSTCLPLGYGCRDTVLSDVNISKTHMISGKHDPVHELIIWSYPSASSAVPDRLLIYNYREKRFSTATIPLYCLFDIHAGGTTNIDAGAFNALYTSTDAMTEGVDSAFWKANAVMQACVSTAGKVSLFSGADLQAIIETGDFIKEDDALLSLSNIRPTIKGLLGNATVRLGYRRGTLDDCTYTGYATVGAISGRALCRATGKRLRVELTVPSHTGIGLSVEGDITKVGIR